MIKDEKEKMSLRAWPKEWRGNLDASAPYRTIHRAKRGDCFVTAHGPKLAMTIVVLFLSVFQVFSSYADDKTWTGPADTTDFFGDENWYPSPHPAPPDNATINAKGANVNLSETFNVKSITLGGNEESYLTTDEFISGTIAPDTASDIAILNRRNGHLILKGPGTVKTKGTYKDSEENLAAQPSLVFSVQ